MKTKRRGKQKKCDLMIQFQTAPVGESQDTAQLDNDELNEMVKIGTAEMVRPMLVKNRNDRTIVDE